MDILMDVYGIDYQINYKTPRSLIWFRGVNYLRDFYDVMPACYLILFRRPSFNRHLVSLILQVLIYSENPRSLYFPKSRLK